MSLALMGEAWCSGYSERLYSCRSRVRISLLIGVFSALSPIKTLNALNNPVFSLQ